MKNNKTSTALAVAVAAVAEYLFWYFSHSWSIMDQWKRQRQRRQHTSSTLFIFIVFVFLSCSFCSWSINIRCVLIYGGVSVCVLCVLYVCLYSIDSGNVGKRHLPNSRKSVDDDDDDSGRMKRERQKKKLIRARAKTPHEICMKIIASKIPLRWATILNGKDDNGDVDERETTNGDDGTGNENIHIQTIYSSPYLNNNKKNEAVSQRSSLCRVMCLCVRCTCVCACTCGIFTNVALDFRYYIRMFNR